MEPGVKTDWQEPACALLLPSRANGRGDMIPNGRGF